MTDIVSKMHKAPPNSLIEFPVLRLTDDKSALTGKMTVTKNSSSLYNDGSCLNGLFVKREGNNKERVQWIVKPDHITTAKFLDYALSKSQEDGNNGVAFSSSGSSGICKEAGTIVASYRAINLPGNVSHLK